MGIRFVPGVRPEMFKGVGLLNGQCMQDENRTANFQEKNIAQHSFKFKVSKRQTYKNYTIKNFHLFLLKSLSLLLFLNSV